MPWIRLNPSRRAGGAPNTERACEASPDEVWSGLGALLACRWMRWVPSLEDAWKGILRSLEMDARTRIVAPFGLSQVIRSAARATGTAVMEVDLDADTGRPRWQALPRASDAERLSRRDVYIVDHRFGFPSPIPDAGPDAAIIEDATAAVGGALDGRAVGSLGDVALVALGQPPFACARGALVAVSAAPADSIMSQVAPDAVPRDVLVALTADLEGLSDWVEGCRAAARVYDSAWRLANLPLRPVLPAPGTAPTYSSYLILVDDPDALAQALDRDGIETRRPFDAPPSFPSTWPGAREFSRRALALPSHPELDLEDLLYVASAVRARLHWPGRRRWRVCER